MKHIFLIIAFISSWILGYCQSWDPIPGGASGNSKYRHIFSMIVYKNRLYVGGIFDSAGGKVVNNIASWDGQKWQSLTTGIVLDSATQEIGGVRALAVYNDKLYVAGGFNNAGGLKVRNVATWDGEKWDNAGPGTTGELSEIYAMAVYNGELYAGGNFDSTGTLYTPRIARWNGKRWSTVGEIGIISNSVFAMTVYNGSLYVGGAFVNYVNADGPTYSIARWDGNNWHGVGAGLMADSRNTADINSLVVYNEELYAGGRMDTADNRLTKGIARWNGANWQALGDGVGDEVSSMAVFNGELFVGGEVNNAEGKKTMGISSWNGKSWQTYDAIDEPGSVEAMAVYNNELYAGIGYWYKSTGSMIAHWKMSAKK